MKHRVRNKLKVKWSKQEKDIKCWYPLGIGTKSDMHYLFCEVFTYKFIKEMQNRGYDITTLKFEIAVDSKGEWFTEGFPTLAKEV